MKVVVNKCFGGFSLSPLAVKLYMEAQGFPFFAILKSIARMVTTLCP